MIRATLLRALVWPAGCTAVVLPLTASAPHVARAELRFTQPTVNAGVVRTGTPLSHRFPFVNLGTQPVEITEARADCGCLTPRLDQRVFKPGEESSLLVEVNTLSQPAGANSWTIHVRVKSGGETLEMPLQLSADLIREVSVQPPLMAVFTDKAVSHEMTVTDFRPKPLNVTAVRASSDRLRPRVRDLFRNESGHAITKIKLDVAEDYPEGRHDEAVTIYTDDPSYRELRVPVTVVKRSRQRVAAVPSQVSLTAPKGQAVPSRIVLLRDNDNLGVVIEKVVTDDPAVVCNWAPGPGSQATLKVRVDRTKMRGETLHSAVHVYISSPKPDVLTIPVTCSAP